MAEAKAQVLMILVKISSRYNENRALSGCTYPKQNLSCLESFNFSWIM